MNIPTINHAALADSTHPEHHFNLGQIFSLALLGLSAYAQQNQPGAGPSIFLNPSVLGPYLQGVASVFAPPPAPPQDQQTEVVAVK